MGGSGLKKQTRRSCMTGKILKAGESIEMSERGNAFQKSRKKEERGVCITSLKKVKRLLGCKVCIQQRVPESEWVDEGLNGLEGKLGMCVYSGMIVCVRACVCVLRYKCNLVFLVHVPNLLGHAKRNSTVLLIIQISCNTLKH